ncbi:MAG: hypothetical protein DMG13_29960, partial [Acidobacteria bacterium]
MWHTSYRNGGGPKFRSQRAIGDGALRVQSDLGEGISSNSSPGVPKLRIKPRFVNQAFYSQSISPKIKVTLIQVCNAVCGT